MCKAIHLPLSAYAELKRICDDVNIGFMSTPFDRPSIECLEAFDMDYWKIPSGEVTNLPYLRRIARPGRRIILSTGMSTLDEVDRAVGILEKGGVQRTDVILLHCTTQYPTPYEAVNLRAMDALATLGCGGVGYSDHTVGIAVPLAAVGHGACVIEKHFTMSRSLPGPDHRASLEYDELRRMVQEIRRIDVALGDDFDFARSAQPAVVERRKPDRLHPVLGDAHVEPEPVADKHRVGRQRGLHDRSFDLLGPEARSGSCEQQRSQYDCFCVYHAIRIGRRGAVSGPAAYLRLNNCISDET